MQPPLGSKKMALSKVADLDTATETWCGSRAMASPRIPLTRRSFIAGAGLAGTAAVVGLRPRHAVAQPRSVLLAMTIKEAAAAPGLDSRWVIESSPSLSSLALRQGDRLRLSIGNALKVPLAAGLVGLDGVQIGQPLLGRTPLEPGQTQDFDLLLTQPGTICIDMRMLGDTLPRPLPVAALAVLEPAPPQADQDHLLLFADRRLRPDGTSIGPALDATGAQAAYTVNGEPTFVLAVRQNERLRLRLINACQRNTIALQFTNHDLRIIGIDGRPAEPFLARDQRVVLAAGSRVDAMLDAVASSGSVSAVLLFDGSAPRPIGRLRYAVGDPIRPQPLPPAEPLPNNPPQLDLARAIRAELKLDGPTAADQAGWLTPKNFVDDKGPPTFRVKRGHTVLLTLANPSTLPVTLRLHGHHFRWLDRLDDGWKPFQPDTLLLDAGQTNRIAFLAQYPGEWLIESAAMDWSAPKRVRWFAVD
jgi:FtsP/CotA-like multicopper oxidase with cupredoxin domain